MDIRFSKAGSAIGNSAFKRFKNYFRNRHADNGTNRYRILKEKNKELLEEDIKEKRVILRAYPPFVGLGTDVRCNLRCVMCTQRLHEKETLLKMPTIEEKYLIKFADEVFPTAETLQMNTAGEPLMSRNFDLELELADKYGVKLDVITNGVLLSNVKGRLEKLCRNAGAIQFSFDSPVRKTYESIRVGSDFDKVVENMRLFQKYRNKLSDAERPFFGINMVLMKRNLSELLQMVKFVKEIGADHLGIAKLQIHTKEMEADSLEPLTHDANFHSLLQNAKKLASDLGVLISTFPLHEDILGSESEQETNIQSSAAEPATELKWCAFLWKRVYITGYANILACCEPSHPIAGNIKDNNFREIWNGDVYLRMRRTFAGGPPWKHCDECARTGYYSGLIPF